MKNDISIQKKAALRSPFRKCHALPVLSDEGKGYDYSSDREIIFKILFQLRNEVDKLKSTLEAMKDSGLHVVPVSTVPAIPQQHYVLTPEGVKADIPSIPEPEDQIPESQPSNSIIEASAEEVFPKTMKDVNLELIRRTLEKHHGKRREAAEELEISERTLYRKIKELSKEKKQIQ